MMRESKRLRETQTTHTPIPTVYAGGPLEGHRTAMDESEKRLSYRLAPTVTSPRAMRWTLLFRGARGCHKSARLVVSSVNSLFKAFARGALGNPIGNKRPEIGRCAAIQCLAGQP